MSYRDEVLKRIPPYKNDRILIENGKIVEEFSDLPSKGRNIVAIKDGKAYMEESDCKNQICVRTESITAENRFPISCLPNGILIYTEDI